MDTVLGTTLTTGLSYLEDPSRIEKMLLRCWQSWLVGLKRVASSSSSSLTTTSSVDFSNIPGSCCNNSRSANGTSGVVMVVGIGGWICLKRALCSLLASRVVC